MEKIRAFLTRLWLQFVDPFPRAPIAPAIQVEEGRAWRRRDMARQVAAEIFVQWITTGASPLTEARVGELAANARHAAAIFVAGETFE